MLAIVSRSSVLMAEDTSNLPTTARVISDLIADYFKQVVGESSESRLLVPAPTESIGRNIQEILTQGLPAGVSSLLVVDGATDKPSEAKGWILPAGLTSKRIGSLVVITQPTQLSRIQESIVGSGGAVRQSFDDEWPWVRSDENELFSFPTLFVPAVISGWTENEADQAWIASFVWNALVPAVRANPQRAKCLFDQLLDGFDPHANPECGDVKRRFLYHCGIPATEDLGLDPDNFLRQSKRLCHNIGRRMESMGREDVIQNAASIEEKPDKLTSAINGFFDSAGADRAIGIETLAISHCLRGLSPADWGLLDCETLARLFEFQERSKLMIVATISSSTGLVSPAGRDIVEIAGCNVSVEVSWSIEGHDSSAEHYKLELKHGQKQLHSEVLTEKVGRKTLSIDTGNDLSTSAKKIALTARIVDRRDPVDPQYKAETVRIHVLRDSRPCCVVLLDPFLVFEATSDIDDDGEEGAVISEPSFVFVADSREDSDCLLSISGEPVPWWMSVTSCSEYLNPSIQAKILAASCR